MQNNNCCSNKENSNKNFLQATLYGLLPHSFCVAFVIFSIIGTVTFTSFLKKILITPYFFHLLVLLSLLLATISGIIYLKKTGNLNVAGIKNKYKYLTILYSTTILVNLLMFFVVFPVLANINSNNPNQENYTNNLIISVQIPCSGHAPLIIDELKNINGISSIYYKLPNIFEIKYNSNTVSEKEIISSDIFNDFKATIK